MGAAVRPAEKAVVGGGDVIRGAAKAAPHFLFSCLLDLPQKMRVFRQ